MIEAHALDAWTRAGDRSSQLYGYLMLLGGMAAPAFLWLAGLGLVLSGEQALSRGRSRGAAAEAIVARGAEVFILAFLFRLQAFIVSPGSAAVTLFRVDILNVMGPAMAAAGAVWGLAGGPRRAAAACAAVGTALAMLTPVVRHAEWVTTLPTWFQWYLRPSGEHTTFTLLPWAGFVFAGAAWGALSGLAPGILERRAWPVLGIAGGSVLLLGYFTATLPSIYTSSSFWTSSPTYVAIRVGVLMVGLAGLAAVSPIAGYVAPAFRVLEQFGRNSLFVYWIHVELIYGYATWLMHRRLPLWGALLAYALFCALMLWAITARDRLLGYWRSTGSAKSTSTPAVQAQL
jgi:uncharacterized membrane protein